LCNSISHARQSLLSVDQLNRHALDVCVVGLTTKQHPKFSLRLPLKAKEGGLALSATSMARIEEQVRIALGLL